MTIRKNTLFVSLFALFAFAAAAQEFRGTVLGRVTDPSGAAVPGAAITITNLETGVTQKAESNQAGNYQIPFLVPGNYRMEFEHAGFQRQERPRIEVNTLALVTVGAVLEIGQNKESITVNADSPLINAVNADLQQAVGKIFVDRIILSKNRDVVNLVTQSPGVAGNFLGARVTDAGNVNMSISGGGGRQGNNQMFVDGMPDSVGGAAYFAYIPSVDTVQELQVQTSLFDAAYGLTQGGTISITTVGGGNDLHGATYLYKRYTPMEANSWLNNRTGTARPPVRFYQAGYNLTGPLYIPKLYNGRNKTFFTNTLEMDTEYEINSPQGRVPTALERQGNFSQTLNSAGTPLLLYDPATTVVNGTTVTRALFPNSTIPANRISPTGSAILNLYPLPNLNVPPQINVINWAVGGNNVIKQRSINGRVDENFNERNRLFFTYGRMRREVDGNLAALPGSQGTYPGNSSNVNYRWFTQAGLDDTIVISPTFVASVKGGFARYNTNDFGGYVGYDPSVLHISPVITQNQFIEGWPGFGIGDGLNSMSNTYGITDDTSFFILSTFTKIHGNHSTKFGSDIRKNHNNYINPGGAAEGTFSFSAAFTTANPLVASSSSTSGSGMASALLGLPSSGHCCPAITQIESIVYRLE